MEEKEIIALWKAQDVKLQQSLAINLQVLKALQIQKAQTNLQALVRIKSRGIFALAIYLIFLGAALIYAITQYSPAANYFIISISAIFLINLIALAYYIKHLAWVNNIHYEESITSMQQKLSRLQLSIIQHLRILCLQLPFWTTFSLSNKWFPASVGWGFLIFQIVVTGSFTYGAYWLYKNQTIKNADKKWFKKLMAGSGNESVRQAIVFLKEIDEFKKDVSAL